MPECAFLTMADMGNFVSDDALAVMLLRKQGWHVDSLPWDQPAHWADYDVVVIRSTWDYHERPSHFLAVLAEIEESGTRLFNPLPLVRWNLDKHYLRDLQSWGVPIVPTIYADCLASSQDLVAHFQTFDAEELILKPPVNVNAFNTFRVSQTTYEILLPDLLAVFGERPYMAQPFLPAISTEGEYSLIYLNGRFSHAILKTPAGGDFRVQEEHGGLITAVSAEDNLLAAGRRAIQALYPTPLYARVDFVRSASDFLIMELELIEPSLYLRMHPAAPQRFVDALAAGLHTPKIRS
jgi:glutathione synthase/RimK-type ligase-like ATP-grasp enzyme